jgi:hypothetical protein
MLRQAGAAAAAPWLSWQHIRLHARGHVVALLVSWCACRPCHGRQATCWAAADGVAACAAQLSFCQCCVASACTTSASEWPRCFPQRAPLATTRCVQTRYRAGRPHRSTLAVWAISASGGVQLSASCTLRGTMHICIFYV